MSVNWTQEQQQVIDLRNRNILVSAAAGSGKTAVLVERIIQRLLDEESPVDVDQLLIVTFTEAAAAEMKERIGAAIEKKLEERPGDPRLEQQATLIHSAPITTIHSFCLSVIRDHFHVIDLDPGFRIAEEGELKLLRQDVLDEMLEEYYGEGKEEFLTFVERFGGGRNDRKVEDIILRLYEYSRSYPQPERWIQSCVDAYEKGQIHQLEAQAVRRVNARAGEIRRVLEHAQSICGEPDGPYMYAEMLESDLVSAEKLENERELEKLYGLAQGFIWKRLSGKRDDTVSPEKKEAVKKLRDQAKKLLKEMQEIYLYAPLEVWTREMGDAGESMRMLAHLVKQFSRMFQERKRSRNMIDFSDMEQFALAVLTVEQNGELIPSPVAGEYQERFEEVMIDEYQDSNIVQETILTSVSRMSEGICNIFMVGDVKQSIYSFRLSRPELFMEKYHAYSVADSDRQRINLHKNFRSRKEVLDSVNRIFRRIMKKDLGGIEYDDSAALYVGADFPDLPGEAQSRGFTHRTELLLFDKEQTGKEQTRKAEARMIARRIQELMREGMVLEKGKGGYRRVQYRDIVILTRSIRGWAEDLAFVLADEGIPAYSVSREGYFETYEVSVLLDYLKILDNARQDLPLAAVLASPFCSLSAQEMAQIRIAYPDLPFHEAAAAYRNEGQESVSGEGLFPRADHMILHHKLTRFYEQMEYFRTKVPYTPIHELLSEIIDGTGYGLCIAAMPGGEQRTANVEMLVEKAAAFEGTSYKGLFNFVRYIGQLKKYDVDYGEAGVMDEQADTVRIMSIHKSKGLEFPIVFAAGLGKKFNTQDTKGSILIHHQWGVGIDWINLSRRTKKATFLKKMIREEQKLEMLAEEMRILYVALTRAKEKLIMTAGTEEQVRNLFQEDGPAADRVFRAEGAQCCLDWIVPVLSELGEEDRTVDIQFFTEEELVPCKAERKADELARDVLMNWDVSKTYVPELKEHLAAQMDYVYPYVQEGKMKLKFTVSELKERTAPAEESGQEMYKEPEIVPLIPAFLKSGESLGGASRGSAYHKVMELLDFATEYDEYRLKEALDRFQDSGRLTEEMTGCIQISDILSFLKCESGKRMSEAARRGKLFKEQPFVLSVEAADIYPGNCSGEKILVQGIIDVYYEEEDGLIVLDYKTDKVRKASDLTEKYHAQLDYYAQALTRLTGKRVKEKVIYSFTLKEEIRV